MSRRAAFFDIDGTIYREGLITEVFKKIIKYELVDKEKWENEVRPAYISWDKRQGDYDTYLLKMVDVYTEAKLQFISYKEMLESHFSAESLKDEKQFPNYFEGISRQEMQYRKWALKNSLFLNPLNDIYYDSFAAHDIIHLPNITTSIK